MNKQIEKLNNFIKVSADAKVFETNEISDGYHTFGELYDHRIALFIALCTIANSVVRGVAWKSKKHSDGTFWEGWFILGLKKHKGKQITYHLPMTYWARLKHIGTLHKAPVWDGHTPSEVVKRLLEL